MKLLNSVNYQDTNSTPYTLEEINAHEDKDRIWATIAECQREAQDAFREIWDRGYWAGKHDKE